LDSLDDAVFTRIDWKLLALADNPRTAGCKKLKGYKDQWRVRIGDWQAEEPVRRQGCLPHMHFADCQIQLRTGH
jgi:mRNA interferase RelE/StbE